MDTLPQEPKICPGCGAKVSPGRRYCLACYHPIEGGPAAEAHTGLASQLNTTHRDDPAIVFLPEERAANLRKRARRKKLIIVGACAIVAVAIGSFVLFRVTRTDKQKKVTVDRDAMAIKELNTLSDAAERFKEDVGRYPLTEEGLVGLQSRPLTAKPGDTGKLENWSGPYLDRDIEVDPWGDDYIYQAEPGGRSFTIFSYGAGGEGSSNIRLVVKSGVQSQLPSPEPQH